MKKLILGLMLVALFPLQSNALSYTVYKQAPEGEYKGATTTTMTLLTMYTSTKYYHHFHQRGENDGNSCALKKIAKIRNKSLIVKEVQKYIELGYNNSLEMAREDEKNTAISEIIKKANNTDIEYYFLIGLLLDKCN